MSQFRGLRLLRRARQQILASRYAIDKQRRRDQRQVGAPEPDVIDRKLCIQVEISVYCPYPAGCLAPQRRQESTGKVKLVIAYPQFQRAPTALREIKIDERFQPVNDTVFSRHAICRLQNALNPLNLSFDAPLKRATANSL